MRQAERNVQGSLKWQIALWYSALVVVALSATSGILVWRFGAIVYGQVQRRADVTVNEILTAATSASPLASAGAPGSPLEILLNSDNLAYWSSPETWIEIDTPAGSPLVKTANLGGERIPPARVDARHATSLRQIEIRGQPAVVEDRFARIGSSDVVIHVAQSLAIVSRALAQARRTVAIVLVIAIVAVVLLSILLASRATDPITELARAMREIGFDHLDRRLKWSRRDEIGTLAEAFDDLLSRLEAAFARERRFISDVSHELKTPLTSINANAQMLLRWAERDERLRRESLLTIARESSALAAMVNDMLTLAQADRGDEIPKEPVSLLDEARTAVRDAEPRAREKRLTLELLPDGNSAIIMANAHLVRQMIGNLVDNAIKFTESGCVQVRVGAAGGEGWVEVRDSGPGIVESDFERVFDRFFRAERSRTRSVPGTGLGLAIVRSIAQAHGGTVIARRAPGGGSLFRVSIPLLTPLS